MAKSFRKLQDENQLMHKRVQQAESHGDSMMTHIAMLEDNRNSMQKQITVAVKSVQDPQIVIANSELELQSQFVDIKPGMGVMVFKMGEAQQAEGWKVEDLVGRQIVVMEAQERGEFYERLLNNPDTTDMDPAEGFAYYKGRLELSFAEQKEILRREERAKAKQLAREQVEEAAKIARKGSPEWKKLKQLLVRKFGTITSAWRVLLDPDGGGDVPFSEFCEAVRHLGFQGGIKDLFPNIDDDNSETITFNEVDPVWYFNLTQLQACVFAKYSSYEECWNDLDANKNNKVDVIEFTDFCTELDYDDNPKQLFRQLLKTTKYTCLTLEDFKYIHKIIDVARQLNSKIAVDFEAALQRQLSISTPTADDTTFPDDPEGYDF